MKQFQIFFLLIVCCVLQSTSCKKDSPEKLPAITNDGRDTFGCFVDGKAFLPSGPLLYGGTLNAVYSLVDGKMSLRIYSKNSKNGVVQRIDFISKDIELTEGKTYNLQKDAKTDNILAIYQKGENQHVREYYVTSPLNGELHISKLNVEQRILSGTFWFDAKSEGNTVEVRDGRFDLKL